jgi:hypothetical protein
MLQLMRPNRSRVGTVYAEDLVIKVLGHSWANSRCLACRVSRANGSTTDIQDAGGHDEHLEPHERSAPA